LRPRAVNRAAVPAAGESQLSSPAGVVRGAPGGVHPCGRRAGARV